MSSPKRLVHTTSRGRTRPWRLHKLRALATAEAFRAFDAALHEQRAARMAECANLIEFGRNGGLLQLKSANRCKQRLCPVCDATGARQDFAVLAARIMIHGREHPRSLPAMLTLTVPNVSLGELGKSIRHILMGYRKLTRMPVFQRAVLGWHRSLEVTYNAARGDFHPHLHVLLMLRDGYFGPSSPLYITQPRWIALWAKAARLPVKVVDIRRVGRDVDGVFIPSADGLFELTKYLVKPSGLYADAATGSAIDADILGHLHAAVKGRRLRDVGGTLRRIRKADLPDRRDEAAASAELAAVEAYQFTEWVDAEGEIHGPDYWQRAPPGVRDA